MEEVDSKVRSTGMVEIVGDVMDEALEDANRSNKGGGEAEGQGTEVASEPKIIFAADGANKRGPRLN